MAVDRTAEVRSGLSNSAQCLVSKSGDSNFASNVQPPQLWDPQAISDQSLSQILRRRKRKLVTARYRPVHFDPCHGGRYCRSQMFHSLLFCAIECDKNRGGLQQCVMKSYKLENAKSLQFLVLRLVEQFDSSTVNDLLTDAPSRDSLHFCVQKFLPNLEKA
jgi:hypothetical protein